MKIIARWESKGGAYFAELYKADGSGFYYKGSGCGGYLGNDITEQAAINFMVERCAPSAGYFQPDANKLPMKRVA